MEQILKTVGKQNICKVGLPFAAVVRTLAPDAQHEPFPYFRARRACARLRWQFAWHPRSLARFRALFDGWLRTAATATATAATGTSRVVDGVALTAGAADLQLPLPGGKLAGALGLTASAAKLGHR